MERNTRRVYRGTVVSDKPEKTIIVEVNTSRRHSLYEKRIKYSKKFAAHDENNEAHTGDIVEIMETRPLSATKRFRLVSIDKKGELSVKEAEKALEAEEAEIVEEATAKEEAE